MPKRSKGLSAPQFRGTEDEWRDSWGLQRQLKACTVVGSVLASCGKQGGLRHSSVEWDRKVFSSREMVLAS